MTLQEDIDAAEARLAYLKRVAASATCVELGHDWQHIGGANCGCSPESSCSVPVHKCTRCGDYDYGHNDEADAQRADCAELGEF
jgi:hypothetical protein